MISASFVKEKSYVNLVCSLVKVCVIVHSALIAFNWNWKKKENVHNVKYLFQTIVNRNGIDNGYMIVNKDSPHILKLNSINTKKNSSIIIVQEQQ